MNITVAITGASGAVYARQLISSLSYREEVGRITVVCTANGESIRLEEGEPVSNYPKVVRIGNGDFHNHTVSGSSCDDAMVIVPCSVGMLARIANGISDDTVSRAADVMLKERRKLIVVVRETPLSLVHLRNMAALAEAGAVVMPACPSFYSQPDSVEALCRTVTDRILSLLGFREGFRWAAEKTEDFQKF